MKQSFEGPLQQARFGRWKTSEVEEEKASIWFLNTHHGHLFRSSNDRRKSTTINQEVLQPQPAAPAVVVTGEGGEQFERPPLAFRRPSAQKPPASHETEVEVNPRGSRPSVSQL